MYIVLFQPFYWKTQIILSVIEMKAFVPFRGYKLSKQRLRQKLPDETVNSLTKEFLGKTIEVIMEIGLSPYILTADKEVLKDYRHIPVLLDKGSSLLIAIRSAFEKLQLPQQEVVCLIMPDIPFINAIEVKQVINKAPCIVKSFDGGITMAIGSVSMVSKIPFGVNSFMKFMASNYTTGVQCIEMETLSFDLDTPSDYAHYNDLSSLSISITDSMDLST